MSDPREPSENEPVENEQQASEAAGKQETPSLPPFPSGSSGSSVPPTAPPVPPAAPPVPPVTPPAQPVAPPEPSYGTPPVYGSAPTPSGTPSVPTPPTYASAPASASASPSPYGPPSSGGGGYATAYAPVPPRKGNGLAITSIVLGGVALLACAIPFLNYLTLFVALAGLIIGLIALIRKLGSRPLSLTGTILSGVAFLLTLALATFYTIQFVNTVDTISDLSTSTAAPYLPDDSPSDSPDSDTLPGDPTAVPGDPAASADAVVCTDGTAIAQGKAGILTYDGGNEAEVSIDAVQLDATDVVMGENSLNTAPPAGYQYALISVTVKQLGSEPFQAGGISAIFKGVAEDIAADADYAVLPEPELLFAPDLTPGASVTGNIAVFVPTSGAESGAVLVSHYSTDNTCELSLQ